MENKINKKILTGIADTNIIQSDIRAANWGHSDKKAVKKDLEAI